MGLKVFECRSCDISEVPRKDNKVHLIWNTCRQEAVVGVHVKEILDRTLESAPRIFLGLVWGRGIYNRKTAEFLTSLICTSGLENNWQSVRFINWLFFLFLASTIKW